jgi:hypothetical protein
MRLITFLALALVTTATAANAGGGHDGHDVVKHIFDVADKDQNGSLTRAEYEDAKLQRFGVSFDESDSNADGETTMAEYLELYQRHHPSEDKGEA